MTKKKKSKRRRKSKFSLRSLFFVILFLLAGGVVFYLFKTYNEIPNNQKKEENVVEKPVEKGENTEEKREEKDEEKGKTPIQNEGEDPNKKPEITGIITSAWKYNNNLRIRVSIDQYLSSGTCKLHLANAQYQHYSAEANISASASTSTCEGFDIPISELSSGEWQIEIIFSSDGKTGNVTGKVKL